MSATTNKYVFNRHIAPITVHIRKDGAIVSTKVLSPEKRDTTTGRIISTGYTTLTGSEYASLCETSTTFKHYRDKLKLLVVSDDIPAGAKTLDGALVDARKEARAALTQVAALTAEVTELKAKLVAAEEAYGKLLSASTDKEKGAAE